MYAEIFLSTELESYIIDRFPRIEFHACRSLPLRKNRARIIFARRGLRSGLRALDRERGGGREAESLN